jgi:hypothetical protein
MSYSALFIYYAVREEDDGEAFMEKEESLVWLSAAVGLVSAIFACFLRLMKSEYRQTFFSTETGCEYAQKFFLEGETDEAKIEILKRNRHKWAKIRGQVGAFTKANWAKWEREEPAWFDEHFKAKVDDDLLPAEALRAMALGEGGERRRRRSSLGEVLRSVGGIGEGGGGGVDGGNTRESVPSPSVISFRRVAAEESFR